MYAFTISEISFCYFIAAPNCFEHSMRQQSKSFHTTMNVRVIVGIFFLLLLCTQGFNNESNYAALFCIWNFIRFTICPVFFCCILFTSSEQFFLSAHQLYSLSFYIVLALNFLSTVCVCISAIQCDNITIANCFGHTQFVLEISTEFFRIVPNETKKWTTSKQ